MFLKTKGIIFRLLVEIKECGRCERIDKLFNECIVARTCGILVSKRMYCRWGLVVRFALRRRIYTIERDDLNSNDSVEMNESIEMFDRWHVSSYP
jgi:hypothetical protein